MNDEFLKFLKKENIPLVMFKMLPKKLQKDIENKYYELKKENEK